MRILLITHYFPPYDHIGSARTGKTAKYLDRFGHDVRVIAARDTLTPFREMPIEIAREKVMYTPWLSAIYRADLALNTLAGKARAKRSTRNGFTNHVRPDSTTSGSMQYRSRITLAGKAVRDALRTVFYFPDSQIGWLPYGLAAGRALLRHWRPDVILASSGPHTALIIGSVLSRESGIPWVAEFRDLWVDNHQYQHPLWRKRIEQALEQRVVSTASGLVTVSSSLAERLRRRYAAEIEVVYNGFDPTDHGGSRISDGSVLTIVYTGWVYEQQDLALLFDAIRKLGPQATRVRIVFYRADSIGIKYLAARYGIADLVDTREGVSFMQSLRIQRAADILLYLSWKDPDEPGIFSGKLFQYFGARRPVLAVGPTQNEPATVIAERRLGFVSADSDEIAARISSWIEEKDSSGSIRDVPDERAAEFSRENQTRKLEAFLTRILDGSPAYA